MPPQSARITVVLEGEDSRLKKTILANAALAGKSINSSVNNSSFLALGRITGKANEFQKSLAASNARVIAFGASAGSIFAVRAAFQLLLSSTIEVEKQLADIDSIFKLGGSNLQRFASNLFGVANATSMAFSEAAKAATELSRQGLSVEETLKRTASALTLSRLSGLSVEESVSSLTATLNSFNREALDSETIINRLTAVDAAYAVSAGDLSKALSRVSASANDAKVSFNETVGLITAAQQITARGGSVIGNAFKSIFTRIQRPQVLDDLEAAGVAVRDLNGQVIPMIQVLRNLAGTYDGLSSSQKSFVSETVGGVYQVNILKAVLRDVGSDVSVFDGAMRAAGDSSGSADRRLKALNNTISSQLVRSMNELTRASSNVGNALIAPGLKTGLSGFEGILGQIANATDANATKQGNIANQGVAVISQGLIKGVGNIIQGPALQHIVFTLAKLLDRLVSYGFNAIKDLDGINSKEKERLAINESIATYLKSQPDLLNDISNGLTSAASGSKAYLDYISKVAEKYRVINTLSSSMGEMVQPQMSVSQVGGVSTVGAASGYIPTDLDAKRESSSAKKAGYTSGRPIKTTVQSGNAGVPIIANTAETKSSIQSGNKIYQFVNPKKGTMAAKTHQSEAIRKTGIDPFALPQQPIWATSYMPHAAKGFIPNLSSRAEAILKEAGINDWEKTIGRYAPNEANLLAAGKKAYPNVPKFEMDWLPDNFVAAVTSHFDDPKDIQKLVHYAQNKIYTAYSKYKEQNPEDKRPRDVLMKEVALKLHSTFYANQEEASTDNGLWGSLRNSITPKDQKGQQDADDNTGISFLRKGRSIHRENLASFIGAILGDKPFDPPAEEAGDPTSLSDATATALLDQYAPTIPTVVLYPKLQELQSAVRDQPDYKAVVKMANRDKKFVVPTPIFHHPTMLGEVLPVAQKNVANMSQEFEGTPGDLANELGGVYNRFVKNRSRRLGYPQDKENALLDIPFDFPEFLKETKFQGPSSGSEVKTSEEEAKKGSPTKLFKSIVGNPDHKTGMLTGPVEAPSSFTGVPKFVEGRKTGIVDYTHFASAKRNEMMTMMIDAIAQKKKALKIIHSPALASVAQMQSLATQMAGGANYITSEADIDQYEQFIWNSSVRTEKGVKSGFSGSLFSLADSVHGVPLPEELTEEKLRDYTNLRKMIKGRKGLQYQGAARGSIPDAFEDMGGFMNNFKLQDTIATKAKEYVRNAPQNIQEKFKQSFAQDFFAGALTNGALGKSFAGDLGVLKKTSGFSDSLFEVMLQDFMAKVNVPELTKRIHLGEFAKGLVPNLNIRDPQVEGLTYAGRKKGINILTMDRTVDSFKDDALKHITKLEQMPPAQQEAYLFKLIGGQHTESSKKIFNKLGSGDQTFLVKEMQGLLGELYAQKLFVASGRKITRQTEAKRFDLSVDEMGPAEVRTRTRINSFPDITDKFKGIKGHKYLIMPSDTRFRAAGEIPEIQDAMARENRATGGNAKLGTSKKLVSQENPMGYVAYDKSSQASPEHAIQQHMALGQNMSKIKSMRSGAKGIIPNLALGDEGFFGGASVLNSVLLGMSAFGGQILESGNSFDKWTRRFGSANAKVEIELKDLAKSFDEAQKELAITGSTTFNKQKFIEKEEGLNQLKNIYDTLKSQKDTPAQKAYREKTVTDRAETKSFGLKGSIIAGGVGGVAGKVAERFSANLGTAIQEFSLGLQTAGQALYTFPNAMGKSLAVGLAVGAVASSVDLFGKGLAQARKDYEVTQSKFQQLSAQVDVIAVSLNNYDNLLNDSTVSLETLVRESRKYSEGIAALGQTPEGRGALTSVVGASDNKEVVQQLMKYRDEQGRAMERQTALLSLKEYAGTKTFKIPGLSPLGDPFSFSNRAEKNTVDQLTRSLASQGVSSMDNETKTALMKVVDSPEKFRDAILNGNKDLMEFLSSIKDTIGLKNVPTVIEGVRQNLTTEKSYTSPEGTAQVRELQKRNASRQVTLDSAIRQEASSRRLFINQGSMRAGNILDTRAMEQKGRYDKGTIESAQRQAAIGVYQLQYGERSVKAYETGGEIQKVENERQNKAAIVSNNTTRQITDALTKSFDDLIKTDNKLGPPGSNNITQLGPNNQELIKALNKGISATVGGGDFSRFSNNGMIDTTKLIKEIAKNAGGRPEVSRGVTEYLQGSNGIDLLKLIETANLELVAINREALTETEKQTAAFNGFKAQMDFKQLSSFMGGLKNLTDRGSRRSGEREAIRSVALLRRGTTAEIRGIGGAGLLEYFKKQNIPLDLSGKSSQSKLMVEAFNASVKGLASVNQTSFNRILNSSQRLGGNVEGLKGETSKAGFFNAAALASVQSEFKPENADLEKKGLGEVDKYTKTFQTSLDISSSAVYHFSDVLMKSSIDVVTAMKNTAKVRETVAAARSKDERELPIAKQQRKATAAAEQANLRGIDFGETGTGLSAWWKQAGQGDLDDKDNRDQYIKNRANTKGTNYFSAAATAVPGITAAATSLATLFFAGKAVVGTAKGVGGVLKGTKNLITKGTTAPVEGQSGFEANFGKIKERSVSATRKVTGKMTSEEIQAILKKNNVANIRIPEPSTKYVETPYSGPKKSYDQGIPSGRQAPPIAIVPPPIAIAPKPPKNRVFIPYSAPDPMKDVNILQEIRSKRAKTIKEVQAITKLPSRETNRTLLKQAQAGGAMGFAASPFGGGVGGAMGGNLASYGLQMAGSQVGGKTGTALMIGSMFAPQAIDSLSQKLIPALSRGGFGIGSRAGVAMGGLGAVGLGIGAAYGGYKVGQSAYNKFSGLGKINEGIQQGEDATNDKLTEYIQKSLKKGRSVSSVKDYLEKQMAVNEAGIKAGGGGGIYSEITGQGAVTNSLKESNNKIAELISHLGDFKEQADQQGKGAALEAKQEDILNKQAQLLDLQIQAVKGTGKTETGTGANMKIEISIKDADKIPELLMEKLINPLKKQLGDLQSQTNTLVNKESPQPAKV